jgi:cell division septal protein FtsQ
VTRKSMRRGLPPAAAGIPALADKRFRRSDVRPGRKRSWRSFARRWALYAGGVLVVAAALWWFANAFMDAGHFRVDRIVVHGNAHLTDDDVGTLVGGARGQSVFRIDLADYRRRVLESPWVASATIWRVFPSTLEVRVVERTPLVIARVDRHLFLMDASGTIIDDAGPEYREFDLPIVDGLIKDGDATANPARIQLAERLLADVAARQDLRKRISQVDVSDARNAVVLLDGEPAKLYLGDTKFLERLQRYEETVQSVSERLPAADYYELRFERVFVGPARPPSSGG